MEGAQLRFDLTHLRATVNDDKALTDLIYSELKKLADRHDLPPTFVMDLKDGVFDKVREQTRRFKSDRREPFPPTNVNNLSVQITLPTLGKVGVTEWNSAVRV